MNRLSISVWNYKKKRLQSIQIQDNWKILNNNYDLAIFLNVWTVCHIARNTWRQQSNLIVYFNHMWFVRRKKTFEFIANAWLKRHAFKSYLFSIDKLKTKQWIHQKLPIIPNNRALKWMQTIIKYQTRVRRSALILNIEWFVSYFFETKYYSELFPRRFSLESKM